ncbi:MAG: hypothetical protein ACKOSS_03440 [Planctomycetia bacterium]
MPRKSEGGRKKKGRGTKPARKAARRAAASEGRGPTHPSRTDRSMPGEVKRRLGRRFTSR